MIGQTGVSPDFLADTDRLALKGLSALSVVSWRLLSSLWNIGSSNEDEHPPR
jgi:hypothetical protein